MIAQVPLLLLLLAIVQNHGVVSSTLPPVVKVLIVGAGPAGLLTAHCLLSRNSPACSYQVHIVDAREEPEKDGIGPRAHSLGIGSRGQNALRYFDTPARSRGLLNHVKALSVATDDIYLHADSVKTQVRRNGGIQPPSLHLPRNKFCQAVVASLREVYGGQKDRLRISYRTPIKALDLNARIAFMENGEKYTYNLIIGADGVRSIVRQAMLGVHASSPSSSPYICIDEALKEGFKVVRLPSIPASLEPNALHILTSKKTPVLVFVLPGADKECYLAFGLRTDDYPSFLLADTSVENIR